MSETFEDRVYILEAELAREKEAREKLEWRAKMISPDEMDYKRLKEWEDLLKEDGLHSVIEQNADLKRRLEEAEKSLANRTAAVAEARELIRELRGTHEEPCELALCDLKERAGKFVERIDDIPPPPDEKAQLTKKYCTTHFTDFAISQKCPLCEEKKAPGPNDPPRNEGLKIESLTFDEGTAQKCTCGENSPDSIVIHRTDGPCYLRERKPTMERDAALHDCKVCEEIRADYYQLIYAVAQKFPSETRHQTALRYIQEREASSIGDSKMDIPKSPEGKGS